MQQRTQTLVSSHTADPLARGARVRSRTMLRHAVETAATAPQIPWNFQIAQAAEGTEIREVVLPIPTGPLFPSSIYHQHRLPIASLPVDQTLEQMALLASTCSWGLVSGADELRGNDLPSGPLGPLRTTARLRSCWSVRRSWFAPFLARPGRLCTSIAFRLRPLLRGRLQSLAKLHLRHENRMLRRILRERRREKRHLGVVKMVDMRRWKGRHLGVEVRIRRGMWISLVGMQMAVICDRWAVRERVQGYSVHAVHDLKRAALNVKAVKSLLL